jgi:hypothetical protein
MLWFLAGLAIYAFGLWCVLALCRAAKDDFEDTDYDDFD